MSTPVRRDSKESFTLFANKIIGLRTLTIIFFLSYWLKKFPFWSVNSEPSLLDKRRATRPSQNNDRIWLVGKGTNNTVRFNIDIQRCLTASRTNCQVNRCYISHIVSDPIWIRHREDKYFVERYKIRNIWLSVSYLRIIYAF